MDTIKVYNEAGQEEIKEVVLLGGTSVGIACHSAKKKRERRERQRREAEARQRSSSSRYGNSYY